MKKWMRILCCLTLALILALSQLAALAEAVEAVSYPVEYRYDMARAQLAMVNAFRTGEDAWAWNESDTEKIYYANLGELVLDPALEEVAMLRAAELAVRYGHDRPDGTSCYTAYPSGYSAMGENIAVGQWSAEEVFGDWLEENDKYRGQGHRRNMLTDYYTSVGFGCVCVNGVYYWAQEFGLGGGSAKSRLTNPVLVGSLPSKIDNLSNVAVSPEALTLKTGESVALPKVTAEAGLWQDYSMHPITAADVKWSADGDAVTVADGQVTAVKAGKATLTATALGQELKVTVTVTDGAGTSEPTGEQVEISEANFPDAAFHTYVAEKFDTDGNGKLSESEIFAAREIRVGNKGISSMKGLEHFSNLNTLDCTGNALTALDLSGNPVLEYVWCGENQLTALDVSKNTALIQLSCYSNRISKLDLSNNARLMKLFCYKNSMRSLDVSSNTGLICLECSSNHLTALDVSKNTSLSTFSASPCRYFVTIYGNQFDLATLPGFDVSKASDWKNGTVNGNILTVAGDAEVSYQYDCGNGKSAEFILKIASSRMGWVELNSVAFSDAVVARQQQVTITAASNTGATRLTMFNGTTPLQHWTEGYTDEGGVRTWKVTCAFDEPGEDQVFTFRVFDDNNVGSLTKTAAITVTNEIAPEPTATPTPAPTAEPTAEPTAAPTEEPAEESKPGDITGDGGVNIMDVIRLLKYVSGWSVNICEENADVTGDGDINIMDVIRLLKAVSGWDVQLN